MRSNGFRHKKYLELLHTESGDQANFRDIVVDHPLIGTPGDTPTGAPVSPIVALTEKWSYELIRWSQLYEKYDVDGCKAHGLRFLPDTDDQASDALLLICYGYKVIRQIDAIPSTFANN